MNRITNLIKENEKLKQDIKDLVSGKKVAFTEVRMPSDLYPKFGDMQIVTWNIATDKTVKGITEALRFKVRLTSKLESDIAFIKKDLMIQENSKNAIGLSLFDAREEITKKGIEINRGKKFLFAVSSALIAQSLFYWYI